MKTLIIITLLSLGCIRAMLGADVQENWDKKCASCHGKVGKADTKAGKKAEAKDLTDAKNQAAFTDEKAIGEIKNGIKDGGKVKMKAAENLSDDEIKALVAHVRTLKK